MNNTIYHVTWTTYNSRINERMIIYKVKSNNEWIFFDLDQEYEVTLLLENIIKELKLKILAYNICKDHIHLLLFSNKNDLSQTIWKLKWKSTILYKGKYGIDEKFSLWWQKFNYSLIENQKQLLNTIKYINNNREKHWLDYNSKLQNINFCLKIIN